MKKFKFKLDALLKVRKLKEDRCKMEIGRLQVMRQEKLNEIDNQQAGIGQAYGDQESTVKKGATGLDLKFYPYFVEGKRSNIKILESEIEQLDQHISHLTKKLAKFRGDVKVLESMRDNHKNAYKKALDKKMDQDLEEQVQIWNNYKANL